MALGFCGIPWCGEALFGSGVLHRMPSMSRVRLIRQALREIRVYFSFFVSFAFASW